MCCSLRAGEAVAPLGMTLRDPVLVSGVSTAGVPDGSVPVCLAAILERDDVPRPAADRPEPWTVWRTWLGTLGLGPVTIRAGDPIRPAE